MDALNLNSIKYEYTETKCDKYDYLVSGVSGVIAGLIDIFFVGMPGKSALSKFTDDQTDNLVKKFAKTVGWNPRSGKEDSISSAIGFLEKKFPVNYDQAHSAATGGALKMSPKNHHYKSLAHSPDIVGLFFSILDQFQGKSSFISDGNLIRIDTKIQNLNTYGSGLPAKLFCGFYNWIGHIMSDLAGSSGGRGAMTGRGSGLSIPFMELFQMCDFGEFNVGNNKVTFARIMTEVFEHGYDFRFGMAMSIPVIMNELIIRTFWVIKRHFYKGKPWNECFPSVKKHDDLRLMLIIGSGALCLIDGADAFIRCGGNVVTFILRLNLIAWVRFIILIFNQLVKVYGSRMIKVLKVFICEISSILTPNERKLIDDYYNRMQQLDEDLQTLLNQYIDIINKEYATIYTELDGINNFKLDVNKRVEHSISLAKIYNVDQSQIIESDEDLENFFL